MAQFAEDARQQREGLFISHAMSTLMSFAALAWLSVASDVFPEHKWLVAVPTLALLYGAIYFIVNPAKVEW